MDQCGSDAIYRQELTICTRRHGIPSRMRKESVMPIPPERSPAGFRTSAKPDRSEEHTSELQSLMRISYAVFCLKKKKPIQPKVFEYTLYTYTYTNDLSTSNTRFYLN